MDTDYDRAINALYDDLIKQKSDNRANRIDYFSQKLLGRPYSDGALGEGPEGQFDQNPLYRCDSFDCVTFINSVLALSLSHDLREFKKNIIKIAYRDAMPRYEFRHHFMSVDWNIYNAKLGLVKDITRSIVDLSDNPIAKIAKAWIDRPNWFKCRTVKDIKLLKKIGKKQTKGLLAQLHAMSLQAVCEESVMPYIPLTELFDQQSNPNEDILSQIPDAAIIEIVRPNWDVRDKIGTHLNVSHVGFALRKKGELIFRHASSIQKCVVDVPLTAYLYERLHSPSIKGINVQKVI